MSWIPPVIVPLKLPEESIVYERSVIAESKTLKVTCLLFKMRSLAHVLGEPQPCTSELVFETFLSPEHKCFVNQLKTGLCESIIQFEFKTGSECG